MCETETKREEIRVCLNKPAAKQPSTLLLLGPTPLLRHRLLNPAGMPGHGFIYSLRQGWAQKLWPWSRAAGPPWGSPPWPTQRCLWLPGGLGIGGYYLNTCRAVAFTADTLVPSFALTSQTSLEEKVLDPASPGKGIVLTHVSPPSHPSSACLTLPTTPIGQTQKARKPSWCSCRVWFSNAQTRAEKNKSGVVNSIQCRKSSRRPSMSYFIKTLDFSLWARKNHKLVSWQSA